MIIIGDPRHFIIKAVQEAHDGECSFDYGCPCHHRKYDIEIGWSISQVARDQADRLIEEIRRDHKQ